MINFKKRSISSNALNERHPLDITYQAISIVESSIKRMKQIYEVDQRYITSRKRMKA